MLIHNIKRLGNLNFLIEGKLYIILKCKIINFKSRVRAPPEFHYTIQKQATLGLPWTLQGEKARGKPSNSLAKKKSYEPRLVNLSKYDATS